MWVVNAPMRSRSAAMCMPPIISRRSDATGACNASRAKAVCSHCRAAESHSSRVAITCSARSSLPTPTRATRPPSSIPHRCTSPRDPRRDDRHSQRSDYALPYPPTTSDATVILHRLTVHEPGRVPPPQRHKRSAREKQRRQLAVRHLRRRHSAVGGLPLEAALGPSCLGACPQEVASSSTGVTDRIRPSSVRCSARGSLVVLPSGPSPISSRRHR